MKTENSVPQERASGPTAEDDRPTDTDTVPSTIEYPKNPTADRFVIEYHVWSFLYETVKLA